MDHPDRHGPKATQALLRAGAGDDPGLDALRVDALVDAVLGRDPIVDAQTNSDRQRRLPRCSCGGAQTAAVVLDLPTALGLAENPGEIPGYGPVPAPVARAMAADRDWVRWTTDPGTGQLLDRGAAGYRPSKKLRAFIAARDRVCGFPGCNRRAQQCDCDHVVTYAHHGRTIRVNLGPLCRAAPQRQDPRPLAAHLPPRHRDQDLDQPAGQDLHQRHRPRARVSSRPATVGPGG